MALQGSQLTCAIKVTAVSVGTGSAQCIGVNQQRGGIIFKNESSTGSIAVCPTSNGAAALNTAGSITLVPNGSMTIFEVRTVDAFNAIASAGSMPLTIWEF